MAGSPSFPFYPGDWMKDPALGMCSPQTRGIWIDFLCAVFNYGHGGSVTGTREQLARLCRCTVAEMDAALGELLQTRTADISFGRNGQITVTSRRLQREAKERENNALRQKRHREKKKSNAPVPRGRESEREEEEEGSGERGGAGGERGDLPPDPEPEPDPLPETAAQVYHRVTGHHPGNYAGEKMDLVVGTAPDRLGLWETVCDTWHETPGWNDRQPMKVLDDFSKQIERLTAPPPAAPAAPGQPKAPLRIVKQGLSAPSGPPPDVVDDVDSFLKTLGV
jgi:hypothetical protein